MDIIISVSNALARWLELSLPRIPSPDGKGVGTQPLSTGFAKVSWQCHLLKHGADDQYFTIVAMEAYSRYVIFLPFHAPPSQMELEQVLLERWGNEALHLAIDSGAITDDELPLMVDAFTHQRCQSHWFNNLDRSINGHITDAGLWFTQTLEQEGLDYLDDNQCYGLAMHINQLEKNIGSRRTTRFRPMIRLLDDALFRFGSGLAASTYPNTKSGDFPCPYPDMPTLDNVVQLADYRKRASR